VPNVFCSTFAISGFRHEVPENCALLGHYATSSNFLPTFRHNLSIPSSGFKKDPKDFGILNPEDGIDKGKGHPCTGTEALYRPYVP